ncbi:hypothetical protein L1887_28111 [Cichorium endivia]|nr:hypothetical protein L1887_28106 [Cichorium endivia]KAI3505826.1 hypothetical protein L1887_28111 [Cichorium endivia]
MALGSDPFPAKLIRPHKILSLLSHPTAQFFSFLLASRSSSPQIPRSPEPGNQRDQLSVFPVFFRSSFPDPQYLLFSHYPAKSALPSP